MSSNPGGVPSACSLQPIVSAFWRGFLFTTVNFWAILYKAACIAVAVAVAIAIVCIFLPQSHRFKEMEGRKLVLQESNAKLEARLRDLNEDQRKFRTDPEFVERIAREQGMAKPGETIFRFQGTNAHAVTRHP